MPETSATPVAQTAKVPGQWERTQSLSKAATGKAPTPPASLKVKVRFVVAEFAAKQVWLSGEFNGWSPEATPMKRHQDGHWEATVDLSPGRYQYKFIVDGQWIPDPKARENVCNQHGTLNSVIEVMG